MKARFRFDASLHPFLHRKNQGGAFDYDCARAATLKNAVEALGVPHTEVGALRVNGEPATLQRIVRDGDEIEIDSPTPGANAGLSFVADAHLGGLARFLRMLGFDTVHRNDLGDDEIRRLAMEEQRVVLTRDRELLKCREIAQGAYVRALKPEAQLAEVADRFALARSARPFTLCLCCNLPLQEVEAETVAPHVPPAVRATQRRFVRCPGCERVYWPGSHYERMRGALRETLPGLP